MTLILVLNGFLPGMYRQITSYLDRTHGSIVVAHKDVINLLGAPSLAKVQGHSVDIVSHDQRIRDIADRVLWLEDGQFKEMELMVVDPV